MPTFSAPANFFGRDQEFSTAVSGLLKHSVIVISGIAGSGKTSFGLKFAAHLNRKETYRDRILWVNCRQGFDAENIVSEISRCVQGICGTKMSLPESQPSSLENLMKILEQNHLLLFIDDFHLIPDSFFEKFVEACVKHLGQGKVIILTRKRHSGEQAGILKIVLGRMEFQDAAIMMDSYLEFHEMAKIPERIKLELYRKTGGHSFSLKLMIGLIASGGYLPENLTDDSSDFMVEREKRLIDQIWEKLTDPEQETLKRLSVFRVPVSVDLLPCKKKPVLQKLLNQYLIEISPSGVSVHDLLREYAADRTTAEEKILFNREAAEIFSWVSGINPPGLIEAFYHYQNSADTEKAVDTVLLLGKKLLTLNENTENFSRILSITLKMGGKYRRQELLRLKAETLLLSRPEEMKEILPEIGSTHVRELLSGEMQLQLNRYSDAVVHYRKALKRSESIEDVISIRMQLGVCYNHLGETKLASRCFAESARRLDQTADFLLKARVYQSYAQFLQFRGKMQKSLEYLEKSGLIFRKAGAFGHLADSLHAKAYALRDLWKLDEAILILKKAVSINRRHRALRRMVRNYSLLACTYCLKKQYTDSISMLRKAARIAEKFDWTREKAILYRGLGETYTMISDRSEAELNFQKAFTLFGKIESPDESVWTDQCYGQFLLFFDEPGKAAVFFEKARKFSIRSDCAEMKVFSSYFLAKAHGMLGNEIPEKAYGKEFEESILVLAPGQQKRTRYDLELFEEALGKSRKKFVLITNQGKRELPLSELEKAGRVKGKHEFYLDFINREMLVKEKNIKIFKKKRLAALLFELVREPGKILKSQLLFENVFARKFDFRIDSDLIRKKIYLLRSLVNDNKTERFIRSAPEKGSYFFNSNLDFCIIYFRDYSPSSSSRSY
ncbi:MAG: NB-ARC domain-containing protein [Candidatus Wallbacteria bacterium]|nr:NB-ARC domain-containing protein [Candidatus Wallbacteria bacterium]